MVNGGPGVSAIFTISCRNDAEIHIGTPAVSFISSHDPCVRRRAALAAAMLLIAVPAAAQDLSVAMNQARLLKLPEGASTLVIGNPAIADATLQPGGLLVITGKSFGRTNLIALDSRGAVLMEHEVAVVQQRNDVVTIYRGPTGGRQTLDCAPLCEPTVTAGDAPDVFDPTVKQINDRNTLSGQK